MTRHLIAPSVLAADFGNLAGELEMINRTEADWLHVDIMDGMFVPNISFGPDIVRVMKKYLVVEVSPTKLTDKCLRTWL